MKMSESEFSRIIFAELGMIRFSFQFERTGKDTDLMTFR